MTASRRAIVPSLLTAAVVLCSACASVEPWQRGRLADPCMIFDARPSDDAYRAHWQEAREGSMGGFGVQSSGCGCK